jgi:hypothetical protein
MSLNTEENFVAELDRGAHLAELESVCGSKIE